MRPTHYLTTPVDYIDDRPGAPIGARVTLGAGLAVEFDGRAPDGRARVFLPPLVIGGRLRALPMLVIPFSWLAPIL